MYTYEIRARVFLGRALGSCLLLANGHVDQHNRILRALDGMAIHQGASISIHVRDGRVLEAVVVELAALPASLLLGAIRVLALAAPGVAQRAARALDGSLGRKHDGQASRVERRRERARR